MAAPRIDIDDSSRTLRASGEWTLAHAGAILDLVRGAPDSASVLDARGIERLDSAGVLLLSRYADRLGLEMDAVPVREEQRALVCAVERVSDDRPPRKRDLGFIAMVGRIGMATRKTYGALHDLLGFFGESLRALARLATAPQRLRLTSTVHHMEQVGIDAMPLVALLNFMVGAVVAFLGASTLRNFGAEMFTVDLVTFAFLREFAVLLTSIILAGRTASAFTAQIGAMKSREEIDAIRTLGLDPVELLVLPRMLALMIMLPLLTFIGMVAGLLGGAVVGSGALGIPFGLYFQRTYEIILVQDFWAGMVKAPVFAVVIALIGCLEGMKVTGTAQSVGERTTSSVVQTLSLVILLDAGAALFFQEIGF
ncbi:MlaE family ABC transporter permease [Coralloluteibacterium stylophorae]|uniref:ABC transporter permease n=1 Tax=Coralloluteibacterium stylophorae TaxID=1776034 RepID=A0A8J7VU21_9GAMM|nr:ABC transporter permease [Coralloluteibacterium stylophorae]MBS7457804.1 ABC transporter permease [Coralloluteibacterium stylophorae]